MRVLLDTCIWKGAKKELEAEGHDVEWVGEWPEDPGDKEILAYAYKEKRVLVTMDKDFGELAIVYDRPHCGIIRLVNLKTTDQSRVCSQVIKRYVEDLRCGGIITAYEGRVRIRSGI
jgi:predicted nuclease of predicted toxin-antitoxin system